MPLVASLVATCPGTCPTYTYPSPSSLTVNPYSVNIFVFLIIILVFILARIAFHVRIHNHNESMEIKALTGAPFRGICLFLLQLTGLSREELSINPLTL